VRGMAHGTPLMPGTGEGQSGEARAHMLDVGLSSTDRIAAFFGIAAAGAAASARPAAGSDARPVRILTETPARPRAEAPRAKPATGAARGAGAARGIQKTIEDALRSAGLMK